MGKEKSLEEDLPWASKIVQSKMVQNTPWSKIGPEADADGKKEPPPQKKEGSKSARTTGDAWIFFQDGLASAAEGQGVI